MPVPSLLRRAGAAPLCASIVALGSVIAPAALTAQPLGPVTVTATRTPRELADVVSDVSIVDAERLRGAGQSSLADVLRLEPGVQATANGGPASNTALFLRGANSGQSLLLIEGFRMSSSTVGAPTFEGMPAMDFARAEVLRGPASSLYGADAMGGVVQLFLPRGTGAASAWAQAGLGSWRTTQLAAGASGAGERGDVAVSVGRMRSAGYDATTPDNAFHHPDRDAWERRHATFNGNLRVAPGHEVGVVLLEQHLSTAFDDGPFDDARNQLLNRLVGVRSSHALGRDATLRLRAGDAIDSNRSVSTFPGTFRTRLRQFGADVDATLGRVLTLSFGAERLDERVATSEYDAGGRRTDALRVLAIADLGAHVVQANARVDRNSQFGTHWTGGLGYGWRFAPGWRWTASAATGFKSPGFNDLYFPFYGRPTIRPETSRGIETGLVRQDADTRARLVLFRSDVDDLIVFASRCPDPDPSFTFGCADNVNRARLQGASASYTVRRGASALTANVDWLDARDITLDRRLPRRAARTASFVLEHRLAQAHVALEWLVSGPRYDDVQNTVRLGGYALLNLRAEWPASRQLTWFARANNVFDRRYETAATFVTPRANVFAGLRLAW